jgi:ubiquinone/menaquinone biosynthesis C-methylase UbiE
MEVTGHAEAQRRIAGRLREFIGGGWVLDVATGTGIMVEAFKRAIGLDASKEMVREARRKFRDREFVVGDVEYLPFRDRVFSAVVSCLAFLWFQNRDKALKEMLRVSSEKVFIVEEEGVPARKRIKIPNQLKPFFKEIEKLEKPIPIKELDELYPRIAEANINSSHKFVCWEIKKKLKG